jgi:hypothetical protein
MKVGKTGVFAKYHAVVNKGTIRNAVILGSE